MNLDSFIRRLELWLLMLDQFWGDFPVYDDALSRFSP